MQEEIKGKSESQLEAWFLESLAATPLPVDHMLAVLAQIGAAGKTDTADSWAELLQEALKKKGDGVSLFRLMKTVSLWRAKDPSFRKTCKDALASVFKDRLGTGFIAASGFAQNLPVDECIRRFGALLELKPGRFCYDKTWGFGVVQRTDDFYQKVTIDFDKKKAHQMSFAYAGEALDLIDKGHIRAVKHAEPERLADLLQNNQAEVVKMTIRSYGPASAPRLKELLVPDMLREADWKNFWDGARKVLKDDPLVDMAAKRNDPIRLREKHRAYDSEWFAEFKGERDVDTVLVRVAELEAAVDDPVETGRQWMEPLADRFAFVVKGCRGNRPELIVRTVMAARRFGLDRVESGGIDGASITQALFDQDQFLACLSKVPARELGAFIAHMAQHDMKLTGDVMIALIHRMAFNILSECMNYLFKAGRENDCAEVFRVRLMARKAGPSMLLWICRNMEQTAGWGLVNASEQLAQVLDDLKETKAGDDLRSQNQLKILLAQKDWLEIVLGKMNADQRSDFVIRLNSSRALDDVTKRSLLALMIIIYPELTKVLTGKAGDGDEAASQRGKFTSWRSYNERQEQYKTLIEKRIPENSRDISVARSYGDLRENHEYKTAKEMQGIFLKKQGELEQDLQTVKGTDFAGMTFDKAGQGTSVTLKRPDGKIQEYVVLGEWDRDEKLGIISCGSRLAQLVEGLRAGDEVMLPAHTSEAGDEKCIIVKVGGLSDEVKRWITGTADTKIADP